MKMQTMLYSTINIPTFHHKFYCPTKHIESAL